MVAAIAVCVNCCEPRTHLDPHGRCSYCYDKVERHRELSPPPFPTQHPPGTIGRMVIYEWRAENGYDLYHELDAAEDPRPNLETTSNWAWFRPLDLPIYRSAG